MNWEKLGKMLFKELSLYKINVENGMINTLRKIISNQGIGHFSLIPNIKLSKENLRQDGWDLMKWKLFLIMDLSESRP
jgi:hypothetical protein